MTGQIVHANCFDMVRQPASFSLAFVIERQNFRFFHLIAADQRRRI